MKVYDDYNCLVAIFDPYFRLLSTNASKTIQELYNIGIGISFDPVDKIIHINDLYIDLNV